MKRFLLILAMVLLPVVASASPFLTCDPYPPGGVQPTLFGVIMDALPESYVAAANVGGSKVLMYDLANLVAGTHNVKVRACIPDLTTTPAGRSCSDYTPFSFSIIPVTPKAPSAPTVFLKP